MGIYKTSMMLIRYEPNVKMLWKERHLLSKIMLELIAAHLFTKLFLKQLWNKQEKKLLSIDVKETKELVCFCTKKGKKEHFDSIDLRNVTVKPLFRDNGMNHDKTILVEDDEIISENKQIKSDRKIQKPIN